MAHDFLIKQLFNSVEVPCKSFVIQHIQQCHGWWSLSSNIYDDNKDGTLHLSTKEGSYGGREFFGWLKGHWRCLLKQLDCDTFNASNIVASCAVLHNIPYILYHKHWASICLTSLYPEFVTETALVIETELLFPQQLWDDETHIDVVHVSDERSHKLNRQ